MSDSQKPDYRDTVFLPKTDFPMRGSLPVKEPELLARWKAMDLHGQLRAQATGREKFILHDGPPYANGNIHIGHALNKILKDVVVRSQQMRGFDTPYVPGWDCHGLPIEWKIEEQYREKGLDKDKVPVLQFRAECRAFAEHWKNVQSEEFQRLGVIGDWTHPYSTMTHKAEAQIVREIHKFLLNGLLYKGVKPVMWSVVEKTALAEAEIEYQDHKSTTLWVKFPIIKSGPALNGASIIIWTTTPWTIPANRAIAFGDFQYVLVQADAVAEDSLVKVGDKLIIAGDLLEAFCASTKITTKTILKNLTPGDLKDVICSHPFRGRAGAEGYFDYDVPLYQGDFVTTEAGTGFVHIAPGHGEDDFNLGKQYKIKFEETVGDDGRYLPNIIGFAGLYVYKPDGKVGEANGAVIKVLLEANALLAKLNITHSYPHSWRSKAPLIFRTTPQWFIALDEKAEGQNKTLREVALQAISDTKWYPGMGENRIRGMIETRPDWCISRQRAWGVPIALFISKKDGQTLKDKAVLDRIDTAFENEGADAWYSHKPQDFLGDKYKVEDYEQVFDIVDVWFESGSTHAFCLKPEGGTSEWPNLQWPADLYMEGSDQHRGWFHSSLLEACGTLNRAPYKAVLTHGFTLDEQGRKMSKSLGNVVAPQEVMDQMGADILRLWVVSTNYVEDQRLGKEILKQTGDLYRRFRNTLRYMLGALDGMGAAERMPVEEILTQAKTKENKTLELECWVLHRLSELDTIIQEDIAKYDFNHMLQELHNFCAVDLSAFYFDIRKDSLYCDRTDSPRRRAARTVMELIFNHLVIWLAPILCFTAEEAYLAHHAEAKDSVHMQTYLKVPAVWRNEQLVEKWKQIRNLRRVVTGAMELARNEKKIGSSLEARPHAYFDVKYKADLDMDFADICICSDLDVTFGGKAPESAFTLADVSGAAVVMRSATGHKCERCWQVLEEVKEETGFLCVRCGDAVAHRKAAA